MICNISHAHSTVTLEFILNRVENSNRRENNFLEVVLDIIKLLDDYTARLLISNVMTMVTHLISCVCQTLGHDLVNVKVKDIARKAAVKHYLSRKPMLITEGKV